MNEKAALGRLFCLSGVPHGTRLCVALQRSAAASANVTPMPHLV
jgi:hypothetical protein